MYAWHKNHKFFLSPIIASKSMRSTSTSIAKDRVSARKFYCSDTVYVPAGSAALPTINFEGDTNTGIYRPADGVVGFSSNGNDVLNLGDTLALSVPITTPTGNLVLNPAGDIDVSGKSIVNAAGFIVDEFGAEAIIAEGYVEYVDQDTPPDDPVDSIRLYSDGRLRYIDATDNYIVVAQDSVDTLSNKTISSDDNLVDANHILTDEITGTYTDGMFLQKSGTTWIPGEILGTGAIDANFAPGGTTISVTTGSVADTVAAGNDGRLQTANKIYVKSANPGPGEYTSIAAALAAVVGNTPSQLSPWLIFVGPGTFIEPTLVVPSYVTVAGSGVGITIVVPSQTILFSPEQNANIHTMSLYGNGTETAFELASCQLVILNNLSISNFGTAFHVTGETTYSQPILFDSMIFPPFNIAIDVDGTAASSSFECSFMITTTTIEGDGSSTSAVSLRGPHAIVKLSNAEVFNVGGDAVYVDDGASLLFQSSQAHDSDCGIRVANVGAAPDIKVSGVTIFDCTEDLVVVHPGTSGVFAGIMTRTKVTVDADAPICLSFVDPEVNASVLVGDFVYSPFNGGTLTETGAQFSYVSPLGTYTGGTLTATGLTVTVAAGQGYVVTGDFPDGQLLKFIWSNTDLVMTVGSVNYIYVDANGPTFASSIPSTYNNLVLGRVVSGAAVEIIDPQQYNAFHPTEANKAMLRNAIGALYASGSTTSANASRQLAISSGRYYYLNNEFSLVGQTSPATFFAYYHVASVWTNASATVVSNTQYDNGTNLVSLPTGKFAKHSLYTVGRGAYEKYLLVFGQEVFDDASAAASGALPTPPNYFTEGIIPIAAIVVSEADATFTDILDIRPMLSGSGGASFGAVTNHGNLTGLLEDDHPQYVLTNGGRTLTGDLDMGSNAVTNATTYNGVTITAHASRHLPNGADALTTAAPLTTITTATTNAVGTANSFARSDHSHAFDQTTINITNTSGTLGVTRGGTGATSLTSGNFLQGNGTSAVTATKVIPAGVVVGTTDSQTLTNKTLTAPVISTIVNTGTLTLPTSTDTLVGRDTVDTLTNKTLTAPVISTIVNTGTLTLPTSTDTLVGRATSDTLTNKTLTLPVISSISNSGTLTLPTGPDTLVGRVSTDTMTNKTLTLPVISSIVNVGTLTLPTSTDTLVGKATTDVLTNKTLTLPVISSISNGGTLTLPTGPDTLVGRVSVDTLTNKILTAPVIATISNTGTLTLPTSTDTLVGRATTDTLTNKTLTLPTISSISNGGTLTLPTGPDTLVGRVSTDTMTNKTLTAPVISTIVNTGTLTLPTSTDTLVGRATTDTMTNKTLTAPVISTIVNTGTLTLPTSTDTLVGRNTTDTLTNKTLTSPVIATIVNSGNLTLPVGPDVLVARTTNDTLTNKILTAPTIATILNIGTLTLPTSTDTLVGRATTDTLTNKTLTAPVISTIVNSGTLTLPTATDTLVARNTGDTLTNKILTLPQISAIYNSGTYALPSGSSDTLVARSSVDVLQNKRLDDASSVFINNADITKRLAFSLTGVNNNTTTTIAVGGVNNTLTMPSSTDTIVARSTADTLTNKSLSDSTTLIVGSVDATKIAKFTLAGATTGTATTFTVSQTADRAITFPDATDTLVGRATTDTLTNKTLTAPVIATISNTGTLTLPTSTDTLVGRNTTDTLTNKSISAATNTITVGGTNITSLLGQDVRSTADVTFNTITTGSTTNGEIDFATSDTIKNRKIVLFGASTGNDHQYYGLGINSNTFRYQALASTADHVFYVGASTTTSTEIFRVKGTGGIQLPTTGGTAASLNYYESTTHKTTFTCNGVTSGALVIAVERIGNLVSLRIPPLSMTFSAAGSINANTILLARWRPATTTQTPAIVQDNGLNIFGRIQNGVGGSIVIGANAAGGNFSAGTIGWQGAINISYLIS